MGRVREDDEDSVGAVRNDLLRHAAHDGGVLGEEVVAAHARLARKPGRDHRDVGAFRKAVVVTADECRVEAVDGRAFPEVERLALGHAFHDVDEGDFVDDVHPSDALGNGCAYVTGAYNGELHT